MPQLRNNHTIPRCLIKEWGVEKSPRFGVHVYEFEKDRVYFSEGKGSGAYSFAIEPNIYVAQKDKKRIVTVEKWLGSIENIFNLVLREIKKNHGSFLSRDKKSFDLFLLALFSLRHRSRHNFESIKRFLDKNPEYKNMIGSGKEDNQNVVILENFINCTIEEAMRFDKCEIIIAENKSGNLLLGDRPFLFNRAEDDYSYIPITPYHLVSIRKTNEDPYYYFNEGALTDEMVHTFNRMIAANSRHWIVAKSEAQLHQYIPFTKEEKEEETPFYQPVEKLVHGYKII